MAAVEGQFAPCHPIHALLMPLDRVSVSFLSSLSPPIVFSRCRLYSQCSTFLHTGAINHQHHPSTKPYHCGTDLACPPIPCFLFLSASMLRSRCASPFTSFPSLSPLLHFAFRGRSAHGFPTSVTAMLYSPAVPASCLLFSSYNDRALTFLSGVYSMFARKIDGYPCCKISPSGIRARSRANRPIQSRTARS